MENNIIDFEEMTDSLFEELESEETPETEESEEKKELIDSDLNFLEEKEDPSENLVNDVVNFLAENDEDFLIYDESHGNYSKEDLLALYKENIKIQSEKLGEKNAELILEESINKLSPTLQKVILGELKGVKISDIIKDLSDFNVLESLPENPSDIEKENLVRVYYKRLSKEKNKSAEWVDKQIEKIIDRDELDSEFEDAKIEISQDLEKSQKQKEELIKQKEKEKEDFKKYHAHFVNESLKEDNLFGIELSKTKKEQIANVLSTFAIRPTDKKEKLGLTALIDNYIHSENPKESYKILALMSLAAIAPNELVEQLRSTSEKKITKEAIRSLKTNQTLTPKIKKQTITKTGNIF